MATIDGYEVGPLAYLRGAVLVEVDLSGADLTGSWNDEERAGLVARSAARSAVLSIQRSDRIRPARSHVTSGVNSKLLSSDDLNV